MAGPAVPAFALSLSPTRFRAFFSLALLAVAGSTEERPAAETAAGVKSLLASPEISEFIRLTRDFLSSNRAKDSISEADRLRLRP